MSSYCTTQLNYPCTFLSLTNFTLVTYTEWDQPGCQRHAIYPQCLWHRLVERDRRIEHPCSNRLDELICFLLKTMLFLFSDEIPTHMLRQLSPAALDYLLPYVASAVASICWIWMSRFRHWLMMNRSTVGIADWMIQHSANRSGKTSAAMRIQLYLSHQFEFKSSSWLKLLWCTCCFPPLYVLARSECETLTFLKSF